MAPHFLCVQDLDPDTETAMHHEAANRLTLRAFDPHSRQPAYKHCAVSVTPTVSREPR